jgi:bleomycin hydrolase
MSQEINFDTIENFTSNLTKHPAYKVAANAAQTNGIYKASQSTQSARSTWTRPSQWKSTPAQSTNQKQSGRCWMFAALNTMRHGIQAQFKIKDFELSQNYTFFWDKFEKSNYFYENVLKTADQPLDSRKVAFLLATPQQDGGQWDMLSALIEKYGIVPKSVMPETYSSSKSNELNGLLNLKLRKDAVTLRKLAADKASDADIEAAKQKMLAEDYRILAYTLGNPPTKFDFEYRDDDKNYHIDRELTPQTFFKKYVGWNLDDYQSIINAPTADKPYNKVFSVEYLGNVVGGRQVRHLNLELSKFKDLIINQLKQGEVVWFGSDVSKGGDREAGLLDTKIYQRDQLFDFDFSMTKAQRLDSGESMMNHAMVITGVDLVDGKPTKWKIENSWGDKPGFKGYFVMSDEWFDQFVYQAVLNKAYLPEDVKQAYDEGKKNPIQLLPWDPMGSLACKYY